jgi:ubiquinone/menaquinone biosynthesis C-methylase UbiE
MPGSGWSSAATAGAYAAFCQEHDMYAATSRDLVELAKASGADCVLDLACGTGQTTRTVLDALGPEGKVHAVDSSSEMLALAREIVVDERVDWHDSPAESVDGIVDSVDAAVCNSAIWQTDMPATFRAVHAVLRPGGRFVANIGRQFLVMPFTEEELNPRAASLFDLMQAIAVLEFGHVPRPTRARGFTIDAVVAMMRDAGFDVVDTPELTYEDSVDRQHAWLRIPVFTERLFPDLDVEQRLAIVDRAYERVKPHSTTARWVAFVAERR